MLSYAPTADFKFRGGYNKAIRSANAFELFEAQNFGLGGSEDICAGPDPGYTEEQCANTGVLPGQYGAILPNPADQYNTLEGGNPDLDAEEADTYTIGFVLTPRGVPGLSVAVDYYNIEIDQAIGNLDAEEADTITFGFVVTPRGVPGLSVAVDYYNIEIDKAIGSLDADDIIQTCAITGDPLLCDLINRDSIGTLWITPEGYTETTTQNIGLLTAEGIDVNFSYMFSMGEAGFLSTDLTGTYLLESRFANPLVDYDCVGYYGFQCGQPNPEWRHRARVTWKSNINLILSMAWRMVGSAEIDDASPDADLGNAGNMESHRINGIARTGAYHWFDLSGTYTFKDGIQWTLGINNILDKEPPLWPELADEFDVNTYATYEPLGRYIFTSMRFDF
jgi:outer membrane receptor protein involved in Fe transport